MESGMGVVVWLRQVCGDGLRRAIALFSAVALIVAVGGCGGDRALAPQPLLSAEDTAKSTNVLGGGLSEVSPPQRLQDLKPFLDVYEPQVRILSPRSGDILEADHVSVQVRVRDLPIYKDQSLALGPHLHLILDDQPPQVIYEPEASIELTELTPGTHTLRLLAVRPWDESFKNEGAFDAVSFDVFAATPRNGIDPSAPLLTYSQAPHPYGAEPILLDFYLTNTPLHLVAEADAAIADWRIRCTVNGQSFVFDQWQPIYLQGFKPGKNWVKLELIDETGQLIANGFNPAVQVIDYEPDEDDPLAQLIRGEIPLAVARRIVDPAYEPPAPVMPGGEEASEDTPEPSELSAPAAESPAAVDQPQVSGDDDSEEPLSVESETEDQPLDEAIPATELDADAVLETAAPEETDLSEEAEQSDDPVVDEDRATAVDGKAGQPSPQDMEADQGTANPAEDVQEETASGEAAVELPPPPMLQPDQVAPTAVPDQGVVAPPDVDVEAQRDLLDAPSSAVSENGELAGSKEQPVLDDVIEDTNKAESSKADHAATAPSSDTSPPPKPSPLIRL
jgi:hypothetical protein